MPSFHRILTAFFACASLFICNLEQTFSQDAGDNHYEARIAPLINKFCIECHSNKLDEADVNFENWTSTAAILKDVSSLQKLNSIVRSGQMPPKDSPQPTVKELGQILNWSSAVLKSQAEKYAGDPGPVVLRRLSNAEYNYSIQDITGLTSLNPTRHFPVDGAAGEGFTNTGNAQGMSPSLFQKYLEAGKEISSHAMLLDNRIEFTKQTTSRDRSDYLIAKIQDLYERFTTNAGATPVNLQGIRFDTNTGGRLPIEKYVAASIKNRDAIANNSKSIEEVAEEESLSPKFLRIFLETMKNTNQDSGFLLNYFKRRWRQCSIEETANLASEIQQWQNALWKFNTIGHIGRPGGAKSWMEDTNPQITRQEFRIPFDRNDASENIKIYFSSRQLLGKQRGHIKWESPRLTGGAEGDLFLRDLKSLVKENEKIRAAALKKTNLFLLAASEIRDKSHDLSFEQTKALVLDVAKRHKVPPKQLQQWLSYLGIRAALPVKVSGHFKQQTTKSGNGYEFIKGWGSPATPSVTANSSDREVRIPGIAKPHSVMVHPSPTLFVAVAWQSPMSGEYEINAEIADHHPECGNGVDWILQHQSPRISSTLWNGEVDRTGKSKMPPKKIRIEKGDLISFYVGPRQSNHVCDLTQIDLRLKHIEKSKTWDLAKDLSPKILESNPHSDSYGNRNVWHMFKGNWADILNKSKKTVQIPAGSELRKWLNSDDFDERVAFADAIQGMIDNPKSLDLPNSQMVNQIRQLMNPYKSDLLRDSLEPDPMFGKSPRSVSPDNQHLYTEFDKTVEFVIPTQLARGRQLIVTAVIDSPASTAATQAYAQLTQPNASTFQSNRPILVPTGKESNLKINEAFDQFRRIFPAALCYKKIVPIDEVVTLTLYHREDEYLKRLFLSQAEAKNLDQLWEDLVFVSREPLKKVVALEQIYQFATQDRPDLVKEFKTLFEPTKKRAEEFQQRLKNSEAVHINNVTEMAAMAWRRPLQRKEIVDLNTFYLKIRSQDIEHDKAIRLTLARIFASPDFLYRREISNPGNNHSPVNQIELASRLSYFLWSSVPDEQLLSLAKTGELSNPTILKNQLRRMLNSPKARRLAIQFACQWLHLRDFENNNDKNEKLFPEFADLRKDMYEETVLFFENLFSENRSVLEIIDSDYLYANKKLTKHYGLPAATVGWTKLDGVRKEGRGGVLGMATVLASQSGASRTSPILRGNWISETLLGEKLPKPPKNVPQLPDQIPKGLTARQLIEKHSSVAACAKCHARIDPYGFALEQFDPLGRIRKTAVDTKTKLIDGQQIEGVAGLKKYLLVKRRKDFLRQFCKKLLGYSLGRETQLSDDPLIEKMIRNLEASQYRIQSAIETILTSDQFLNIRDKEYEREN